MHDWEGEGRSCLNVKFPRFVPTGNDVNAARFGMRCHDADSSHVDWARARARPSVPPGSRRAASARARSRCLGRGRSVRVGNGNLAYFSQQAGKGYRARVRQAPGRPPDSARASQSVCLAGGYSATTACWMNFDVLFRMERIIISLLLHTSSYDMRATCDVRDLRG